MCDIKKLHYDLALNCALLMVWQQMSSLTTEEKTEFRLSKAMIEAMESASFDLASMDVEHLRKLQKTIIYDQNHMTDLSKTIK